MSERNPVEELTAALTSLRVDLNKVAQQIEAKAATPAHLAELVKAIKANSPDAISASIETASTSLRENVSQSLAVPALNLKTAAGRIAALENTLTETTAALSAAIIEAKKAGRWLNIRAALVLTIAVGLVAGGSYASLWWQERQADGLKAQEAALTAQITQERAAVASLAAKGGRIKWNSCGGRVCFQVAQNQGISDGSNPFANWGGWTVTATKAPLVIPDGY